MDPLSLFLLLVMGTLAGAINAAVGSGSLLTLPVLLALGIPPGTAVRTNTLGILFSTIGSVAGYRREIAAEARALRPLMITTAVMASAGSILLLLSPPSALSVLVPVLIVVALAMVVFQKPLTAAVQRGAVRRRERRGGTDGDATSDPTSDPASLPAAGRSPYRSPALIGAMGAASVYGGYFTAAQGILYLGVLGSLTGKPLGQVNHVKNLASLVVNLAAAIVYLVAHVIWGVEIVWIAAAAIAVGALLGGYFGAHLAKRLPENALRGVIVVVALVALVRQLT